MCCSSSGYGVNQVLREHRGEQFVTGYKVLLRTGKSLTSAVRTTTKWKPGVKKSNTPNVLHDYSLNEGIHVYLKRSSAVREKTNYGSNSVIVAVKCSLKDLRGSTGDHSVFSKVELSVSEYDKAMKVKAIR